MIKSLFIALSMSLAFVSCQWVTQDIVVESVAIGAITRGVDSGKMSIDDCVKAASVFNTLKSGEFITYEEYKLIEAELLKEVNLPSGVRFFITSVSDNLYKSMSTNYPSKQRLIHLSGVMYDAFTTVIASYTVAPVELRK